MKDVSLRSQRTDTSSFSYVRRKAERLSTALHLITDHLDRDDSITRLLRESGLSLIKDVSLLVVEPGTKVKAHARVSEILSFLAVAYQCGYISEGNFRLIESEYQELEHFILAQGDQFFGTLFPKSFFQVPFREEKIERQLPTPQRQQTKTASALAPSPRGTGASGQASRKDIILDLLKTKDRVNVKDVAEVITDCSDKTLQRELLGLVETGVLVKEGERRWSTYRLA